MGWGDVFDSAWNAASGAARAVADQVASTVAAAAQFAEGVIDAGLAAVTGAASRLVGAAAGLVQQGYQAIDQQFNHSPAGHSVQPCPKPKVAYASDGAKYVIQSPHYKNCPDAVKKEIKSKQFTDAEKKMIDEVQGKYATLMTCKNQPLKRFGRTDKGITDCKVESSTMGECFDDSGTLVIMDNAYSPVDFKDENTQFKGTVAHEMSHIIMNRFDPRTCKTYDSPDDNPLMKEYRKATGWDATGSTLTETAKDHAPSEYGKTNSQEDMAESSMLYLYNPDELEKKSPARYAFMKQMFGG